MSQERKYSQVVKKQITELIPYINNPRKIGDDAVNAVASSIKNFGFKSPIIIDAQNEIIAGHTRYLAAKKLGMTEVPCVIADDLTPAERRAYRIADNKTGEYAEWDDTLLGVELEMLVEEFGDLSELADMVAFPEEEISALLDSLHADMEDVEHLELDEEDLELPEEGEEITQPGDLWELGPHRLLCGDTTDPDDMQRLMDGKLARMVFTDPPYNVDYVGKTKEALTIENDHMEDSSFRQFLLDSFESLVSVTESGSAIYICHADSEGINFRTAMVDAGWLQKQTIIWVKDSFVMGRQDYHWRHEPILYGWKPGASHRYYGGRNQDTVWEIKRPKRNEIHPTMKPVELAIRAIKNSSLVGEIVVDGFGGGGSTLIAADHTDRVARLMELDPKYCDAIVRRYVKYCLAEDKPILVKLNGSKYDHTVLVDEV